MKWLNFFFKFDVFTATTQYLSAERIAHTALRETTSTNEIAKDEAFSSGETFKVYLTDRQSAGRGRSGNTWLNPKVGQSLMATFSFDVDLAPQPITAPLAGLAIYRALAEVWPTAPLAVKAPNDILLDGQKICGILVETVQAGHQYRLIIGMGLNVFGSPPNLPEAGSLGTHQRINKKTWHLFLKKLVMHLQWAAQGSQTAHLSDSDRAILLNALNQNPHLTKNYVSLSPFGDLTTDTETISWRSL